MALMGLKYVAWAKQATDSTSAVPTFDAGKVLGKAVSANLAITNAEGELYADDMQSEYIKEFSSAALTLEVDNISIEDQATLYGSTYSDGEMQGFAADNAPYGGIGCYQVVTISNVRKYRAWFFPKAKASTPDWSAATRGSSISFGTQPLSLKIMAPNYGAWYRVKEFATEAAARAYIDGLLGVAVWHSVDIQANGAGAGEAVSPIGANSVAAGDNFVITITGTATAVYDNGVDNVGDVAGGKYTITSAAADHSVAVIF